MNENASDPLGRATPGAIPPNAPPPRVHPPHDDMKDIGDSIRERLAAEQDAARQVLGTYRDEVYDSAELAARDAANTEAGLRARVSDAADAVRERASESARHVRERATESYDEARAWASDGIEHQRRRAAVLARRGYGRVRRGRRATEDFVSDNPLLVGVVGIAAGMLLGALLPRTRQEDRTIGPWADEAREQGIRYARDMTQRGRDFVVSALDPDNLEASDQPRREAGLYRDSDYRDDERPAHRL